MKSPITTHVLDTTVGKPAQGLKVLLETASGTHDWKEVARGQTDSDGRITDLLKDSSSLEPGNYRLTFFTEPYFKSIGVHGFYPSVVVNFQLTEKTAHCHIPLLVSPHGYTTYKGS